MHLSLTARSSVIPSFPLRGGKGDGKRRPSAKEPKKAKKSEAKAAAAAEKPKGRTYNPQFSMFIFTFDCKKHPM
jgi:hypothetical protein